MTKDDLIDIHNKFYNTKMELDPMSATFNLDYRFDSEYIHCSTEEYRRKSNEMITTFRNLIKNSSKKDKFLDIMSYVLDLEERFINLPFYLRPVNHYNDPFKDILDLIDADRVPLDKKDGFLNFQKRIFKFISQIPEIKQNILLGLKYKVAESKTCTLLLAEYLKKISKKTLDTDLIKKLKIREEYLSFMTIFIEAAHDFASFLESIMKKLPTKLGLANIENKKLRQKMYQFCIDSETNITGLRTSDIYKLGLKLVSEYDILKKNMGPLVKKNYLFSKFKTEKEVLDSYTEKNNYLFKNLRPLFEVPKTYKLGPVKLINEKDQALANYISTDITFKKIGTFNLNMSQGPSAFFKGDVLYLSMHENAFGHGYQIPMMLSMSKEIPKWLLLTPWNSTDEGWALYCEWLLLQPEISNLIEISDIEKYAILNSIQLRNVRLVVDVLINYYGLSFNKVKNFIKEHVEMSESELTQEIYRYSAIPAQALSYSIGQQYILRLRKKYLGNSGNSLGSIRGFHKHFIDNSYKPIGLIL